MPSARIFSGVSATGKSLRVAMFTPLSVACADRITATSNSKGVPYSRSDSGCGLSSCMRRKNSWRCDAFINAMFYVSSIACSCCVSFSQHRALPGRQRLIAFTSIARQPEIVELETCPCDWRMQRGRIVRVRRHADAIDGAGRDAQIAAGAEFGNHRVHQLAGADDRVGGASSKAFGAADAGGFIDHRDAMRQVVAARRIQRYHGAPLQLRQPGEAGMPARPAAGYLRLDCG